MGNEIQNKLNELKLKGWTLASIAREIHVSTRAVESWNQGKRSPANLQPVIYSLNKLNEYKRIPKKKVYQKGSRNNEANKSTIDK
jgi:transcriptional regulator with XRE-family HTH domain